MKTVLIALVVAGVLTLAGLGRPAGPAAAAHARPGGSGSASSSVVSLRGSHLLPDIKPRRHPRCGSPGAAVNITIGQKPPPPFQCP